MGYLPYLLPFPSTGGWASWWRTCVARRSNWETAELGDVGRRCLWNPRISMGFRMIFLLRMQLRFLEKSSLWVAWFKKMVQYMIHFMQKALPKLLVWLKLVYWLLIVPSATNEAKWVRVRTLDIQNTLNIRDIDYNYNPASSCFPKTCTFQNHNFLKVSGIWPSTLCAVYHIFVFHL